MLLNNRSVINITKTLDLTQEQLNKINSIDTLTTSIDTLTTSIDTINTKIGNVNSGIIKDIEDIKSIQTENLNAAVSTLENTLDIDSIIGNENLTTTATTLTGAINEINAKNI